MEKRIVEALKDVYFYMQYGRLMPGFVHNINGRITAVDSKLQLFNMKVQMKLKKLDAAKETMTEAEYNFKKSEYEEMLKVSEQLKEPMTELNGLMKVINDKIFNENTPGIQMIDINGAVKAFCEFYKFDKKFKHDTEVTTELDGNPFIKMEYRDIFFILYAVTSKILDSISDEAKDGKIYFRTENSDESVLLSITTNGKIDLCVGDECSPDADNYFLDHVLCKYPGFERSVSQEGENSVFKIKLLKKQV